MEINGTLFSLRNLENISQNQQVLGKQLSSGERVFSASVDPAASAVVSKLAGRLNEYDQQISNYQQEYNMLATKEGALSTVSDSMQELRTLQVQYKNDTLTDDDRAKLEQQARGIVDSLTETVTNAEYNTISLIEPSEGLQNIIDNGFDLGGSLEDTQGVINEVAQERADIGAQMNGIEARIDDTATAYENTLGAYSTINDMDMARGITDNTTQNILEQAGLYGLGSVMNLNRSLVSKLFE